MDISDLIYGDRRSERRYDFQLALRFSYQHWGFVTCGRGRTLDLSRTSIRFEADEPVPDGIEIELQIDWPFLLHDVHPLILRVAGVVLRTDQRGTVLRMTHRDLQRADRNAEGGRQGPTGFGLIA